MFNLFKPEFDRRIAMAIEYDGSSYNGWQTQNSGVPTLQQALELALSKVANHQVKVICSGRTDSGVHATNQIIHFDTHAQRKLFGWGSGTNKYLPNNMRVNWAKEVPLSFHARFSAKQRRYRYLMYSNPYPHAILNAGVTWERRTLDVQLMHQAAQYLLGTHDFSAVRAVGCQAHSPIKTVTSISVSAVAGLIVLDIEANSFLYHMVRNIIGLLIPVGAKEQPLGWVKRILQSKDRKLAGITALPNGLYFVKATYGDEFALPEHPIGPVFLPDRINE